MNKLFLASGIIITAICTLSLVTVQFVNTHCAGATLTPPLACPHLDATVPVLGLLVGLGLIGYSIRAKPRATHVPTLDSQNNSERVP
jgi:hypothetical protein